MIVLKVLHIVSALVGGGVESSIMGSYRVLKDSGVTFDFVVFTDRVGMLEEEVKSYGGTVYHIPSRRESYFGSIKAIKRIMREGDHEIVHCHLAEKGFWFYFYAKRYGKKCIMHTHGCWNEQSLLKTLKKRILTHFSLKYCDMCCSCSTRSAKYVFEKDYKKSNIVLNAFKTEKFLFSDSDRREIRQEFGVADGDFLIGAIGRLSAEKNQGFLIKILAEILKKRKNAKLLLVGDGAMRAEWERLANDLADGRVIFAGNVKNPEKYYSALDAFSLPSINEGFGMALVEAQLNGLKCVVSSYITDEAIVKSEDAVKIPLSDEKAWADAFVNIPCGYERAVDIKAFEKFSAKNVAEQLLTLYNKLV